jgi:hypothetical protein
LYFQPQIIRVIKSGRIKWAELGFHEEEEKRPQEFGGDT